MWSGFVGQRIAATTKALRRLGLGLVFAALALALYGAKTFLNVMQGPAQFDEARLAAITNPTLELRDYVTVQGHDTVSTGLTSIVKTTRNGKVESQRTTGEFMAIVVGKHILVVKARVGEVAPKYTGGVIQLPDDVKKSFFADLTEPELRAATLPIMIDATGDYGDGLVLGYIALGALVFSGFWALVLSKRRAENPERHPLCKTLSDYGPLYTVVPQIDAEYSAAYSSLGRVTFTRNWVICCGLAESLVMRRDEIVWAYKKRTKHSVNFVPTGTSFALILRDRRGKLLEVSATEGEVDSYLSSLAQQTPWIIFGYGHKLEKLYRKERQTFAQAVSERKQAMLAGA